MKRSCAQLGVCQRATPPCADCDWMQCEAASVRAAGDQTGANLTDEQVMAFIDADRTPPGGNDDVFALVRGFGYGALALLLGAATVAVALRLVVS